MKEKNIKILLKIIISIIVLLFVLLISNQTNVVLASNEEENQDYCYLSDISYVQGKSSAASGHSIKLDQNDSNSMLKLKVDNKEKSFYKGICAWASSTIVYDLRQYDYDYFTAYLGVDISEQNNYFNTGLKFFIYTSDDGESWVEKLKTGAMYGWTNAQFAKVDIKGANYLKLVADKNSNNWWAEWYDEALYADAKLIKEGYEEDTSPVDFIKTVAEYDEELKKYYGQEITGEYEKNLLRRKLVSNAGYDVLQFYAKYKTSYRDTLKWLMFGDDLIDGTDDDLENLRLYIHGGAPAGGSYLKSITQLTRLYNEYSEDFKNEELLNNKWYPDMTYGDLYRKMAITLSLTHAQTVALWMHSGPKVNQSDALERYAIFKYLHDDGKLRASATIDRTEWFEALKVEEMRFIMNNSIDDEEILWLNAYVKTKIIEQPNKAWLTPHPHMAYKWPDYTNKLYYENDEYFNDLFKVRPETLNEDYVEDINRTGLFDLTFKIPGGKNISEYTISITKGTINNKISKVWMNFRNKFGTGAVCGGISKSGSNIRTTHGIPATVIGQPGHAALLFYSKDADGKGYWGIDNDVSGWSLSEKGERMLLGWGNGYGYSVVYMALAQEAINDYEKLEKCQKLVMLADTYKGDLKTQEEIYRKALEVQSINIDAWRGLINVYNQSETKTQEQYYKLAEDVAENLKYFPLPMYHLTNLIQPKLTTTGDEQGNAKHSYLFTLLQTKTLEFGTKASNTDENGNFEYHVYQPSVTKVEAKYLLGKMDKTIATFSFDGADAGKIVLSSRFNGNGVRWDYCINGDTQNKNSWKECYFDAEEPHKWQLTQEELNSITPETDIYVHIVGVNYDEENLYKIDITNQALLTGLYANDLENRIVGINLSTEWRYTENDVWTSYSVTSPDLTGDKIVQVRQAATGTKVASPASEFYTFTQEDDKEGRRKYITVSHLSINSYSTQSVDSKRPFYAPNAIDGNMNTLWHTDFSKDIRQEEGNPFMIIELDRAKYISALEFAQIKYPGKPNDPDFVKNVTIYVSEDGENWTEAGRIENCDDYNALREVTFTESVYGKYVKLEMGKDDMFSSIAMINLFEDTTKIDNTIPTASVYYSPEEPTNQYVIARLVNPNKEITITNNNGKDTYVFTENGNFTFEFEDSEGNTGSAYAEVNWIKKDAPTADVEYKLSSDRKLSILLDNISEDVYLLDKDNNKINYIEVEKQGEKKIVKRVTYIDSLGNAYKVAELDEKGVIKKVRYKNTTGAVSNVTEYVTIIEDGKVVDEEYYDSEGNSVTVTDAEKQTLGALQQAISNPLECYLEQGGDYQFRLLDKASNIAYKSIKADYINNNTKVLVSDISYDITRQTNENVTATINTYAIDNEGQKEEIDTIIINENGEMSAGEKTHTFEENDEFTFRYTDKASTDVKSHTAKVTWIDKDTPTAEIRYSTKETTNGPVVATLVNESEEIIIINNGTSKEYTFTENDEFTFKFIDKAGNEGTATAKVDWIAKTPTDYLIGDINQDGKITATDLLLEKRHLVAGSKQEWILTGNKFKAGDINTDGKITATDLILIKRLVLKNIGKN